MLENFECQVCGSKQWQILERFLFYKTDHEHPVRSTWPLLLRKLKILGRRIVFARPYLHPVRCRVLNDYQIKRRQVLFDVWFRGSDAISLQSIFCSICGFATYSPRPEVEDVAAKYNYLRTVDPDIGGESGHDEYSRMLDSERAHRIFRLTTSYLQSRPLRILDYGGGNGKLMRPFLDAGHDCYLVDYSERQIPDVKKIGNDINDMSAPWCFDLILCCHVLEHVSNLSDLVAILRSHLCRDGILYAEVPHEIWAGICIDADPVTHINFFTTNSLSRLISGAGMSVVERNREISNYGKSHLEVIWVVAEAVGGSKPETFENDIRDALFPRRWSSLKKVLSINVFPKLRKLAKR